MIRRASRCRTVLAVLFAAFAAEPGWAEDPLSRLPPMLRLDATVRGSIVRMEPGVDTSVIRFSRVSVPPSELQPRRVPFQAPAPAIPAEDLRTWRVPFRARPPAVPGARPLDCCGRISGCFVSGFGGLPLRGVSLALPAVGLTRSESRQAAAALVFAGLLDGSLDSRSPEWRPYLAWLLASPRADATAEVVFPLLLAGCEGVDDNARIVVAENWARRYDAGRFSGVVTYACAQNLFNSGLYDQVILRCDALARTDDSFAARALRLKVLAEAYAGTLDQAKRTLADAETRYAGSREMPELRYLEAWLDLQELRTDEAKAILRSIIRDPSAGSAAVKAAKVLESLESTP